MSSDSAAIEAFSTAQETSLFEEDWKSWMGDGSFEGLGAIAQFNASFDSNTNRDFIDPQFLSKTSYEAGTPGLIFDNTLDAVVDLPDTSEANIVYPPPRTSTQQTTTPYFPPSIEFPAELFQNMPPPPPQQHLCNPSQFHQSLHRRSVSEPPTGPNPDNFRHQHYQPSPGMQAQMIFHRQGHYLGKPQAPTRAQTVKGKVRFHPYPTHAKMKRGRTPGQTGSGPTSVPAPVAIGGMPCEKIEVENVRMSPLQYVSTRICTPTPSPERGLSPPNEPIGSVQAEEEEKKVLSIPMTVERLQEMITEAVKKAMKEDVPSEVVDKAESGDAEVYGDALETVEMA